MWSQSYCVCSPVDIGRYSLRWITFNSCYLLTKHSWSFIAVSLLVNMCTNRVSLRNIVKSNRFVYLLTRQRWFHRDAMFLFFFLSFWTGIVRAHCASMEKQPEALVLSVCCFYEKVIKFVVNSYVPWFFPWIKTAHNALYFKPISAKRVQLRAKSILQGDTNK